MKTGGSVSIWVIRGWSIRKNVVAELNWVESVVPNALWRSRLSNQRVGDYALHPLGTFKMATAFFNALTSMQIFVGDQVRFGP